MLQFDNVKRTVLDILENDYILFVGHSTIDILSKQLGRRITEYKDLYSANTGERIYHTLDDSIDNNYSVLKYTENVQLKENIEYICFDSNDDLENFLIPCFEILIESNSLSTQENYVKLTSGYVKYYFTDKTTKKTTTNYIYTSYIIYTDNDDKDSSNDYYLVKTNTYFKEKGRYLTVEHYKPNVFNPFIVDVKPTSSSGTTSYNFTIWNMGISYTGPRTQIILTQPNRYTANWTFIENSLLSKDHESGDVFGCATEFAMQQGKTFLVHITISGLDRANGEVVEQTKAVSV